MAAFLQFSNIAAFRQNSAVAEKRCHGSENGLFSLLRQKNSAMAFAYASMQVAEHENNTDKEINTSISCKLQNISLRTNAAVHVIASISTKPEKGFPVI